MITHKPQDKLAIDGCPTIWGLTPSELHDRYWAARGVQVVRPGIESEIVEDAELFLLMGPKLLTIYRLRPLVDQLSWINPDMMWIRLHHNREYAYQETALTDDRGRFIRFKRVYGGTDAQLARVALTPHQTIARLWQLAPSVQAGWRILRQQVPSNRRTIASINGHTYDRQSDEEVMQFTRHLIQTWTRPDATIERLKRLGAGVWADEQAELSSNIEYIGPTWIGAGRSVAEPTSIIGPAVLWDDPDARPQTNTVKWRNLEPTQDFNKPLARKVHSTLYLQSKRVFDLLFIALSLVFVLPIFPIILLAIYLEDGRPFFFVHWRETLGGRQFPCLKFRSMYRNAENSKSDLSTHNEVDGPQFYIRKDPRLTRVGQILRKFHLDELPQFFNVLAGHMSVVGPRPSPFDENQYSPTWREARLSVLPGITGLWQVMRTRQEGLDFQEWIKFDIKYVETASLKLDLWILWKTFTHIIRGK